MLPNPQAARQMRIVLPVLPVSGRRSASHCDKSSQRGGGLGLCIAAQDFARVYGYYKVSELGAT